MGRKKAHLDDNLPKKIQEFDTKEQRILKELILNPRASDNKISTITGIPAKTVQRKRKAMEQQHLVSYATYVNNYEYGTKRFNAKCMYTIYFNLGITKEQLKAVINQKVFKAHPAVIKHILLDFIGEKDGMAVYTTILVSRASADMVEILNAEIIPLFHNILGHASVHRVEEITVRIFNKIGHNFYIDSMFEGTPRDSNTIYVSD
jgi:DNA-binding Lrp family transcriptional regulator